MRSHPLGYPQDRSSPSMHYLSILNSYGEWPNAILKLHYNWIKLLVISGVDSTCDICARIFRHLLYGLLLRQYNRCSDIRLKGVFYSFGIPVSRSFSSLVTMNGIGSMLDVLFNFKYLLLISFLLGVVVLVEWISYNRLSNFKGPFWASVTNLWMAKSVYYRNAHLDLFHAYQEYGSGA